MSGDYSVVTQSMVNVKVSSNATSFLSERKIPKEMKIIELKVSKAWPYELKFIAWPAYSYFQQLLTKLLVLATSIAAHIHNSMICS